MAKEKRKEKKKGNTASILWKAVKEVRRLVPGLLTTTMLGSAIGPVAPFVNIYFSARIIDELSGAKDIKKLVIMVVCALALNFICFIATQGLSKRQQFLNNFLYNQERSEIAKVLYGVDYDKLENPDFQERIKKHYESGEKIGPALCHILYFIDGQLRGAITLIIAVTMIWPLLKIGFTPTGDSFMERPAFLITLLAVIAVAVVIILLMSNKLSKVWYKLNDDFLVSYKTFDYYRNMLNDYKTGKEVRIYNEQKMIEKDATERLLTKGMELNRKMAANTAKSSSLIAIIGALLGFGVYLFIGVKGLLGLFSIGSLVQYSGSFMQVIAGVTSIANTAGKIPQYLPALNYYFDIIETKSEREKGSKKLPSGENYEIEFRNVSFKYPAAETYALKNFSMKLTKEDHLAVVGRNGSGKTTFIKLLCRMYDPTEGEILLNGINIKKYDEQEYAKLFSVVFQDFSLFSYPVAENIACGDDFDTGKVWECLESSGAADKVRQMPKQLETHLYKDLDKEGIEISGGEAQKMALSRALYKDAPFVVLDEPTAALDPIAEFDIYSRFNQFVNEKAAIYISHRLSSCRFCNHIAVFDSGKLVQLGTHEQLIQDINGKYYDLWNAQAQYYC